jgi:hypothetical protein
MRPASKSDESAPAPDADSEPKSEDAPKAEPASASEEEQRNRRTGLDFGLLEL